MNAARVVFGAEPGDAELLDWIISGYPGAVFSPGVYAPREVKLAGNPKRRQRQATRALERGISTRSLSRRSRLRAKRLRQSGTSAQSCAARNTPSGSLP